MTDERLAELKEKYKERNLLVELVWGAYANHMGYTSKQNGEFLNWLCMMAYKTLKARQDEWIPIRYRPLTEKERISFAEYFGVEYCDTSDEKAFDCPMPEDRQEILISTSWGVVEDVADNDIDGEGFIYYGLENNGDWDGVDAWMPKPERYKKGGNDQ